MAEHNNYQYDENPEEAANRHYVDAKKPETDKRFDNAGYHYGLAAECAIKRALIRAGISRSNPVINAHFPKLREYGMQSLQGRNANKIYNLLQKQNFMQHWDIKMRYSSNGMIDASKAEKWRKDADQAIGFLY